MSICSIEGISGNPPSELDLSFNTFINASSEINLSDLIIEHNDTKVGHSRNDEVSTGDESGEYTYADLPNVSGNQSASSFNKDTEYQLVVHKLLLRK